MKFNQKGFSAVIVLLSIIAIAVVGFVGYYVYDEQSAKTVDTTEVSEERVAGDTVKENNSVEVSEKLAENMLVIKEWGVKIPLTDATRSATYRIENNNAILMVSIVGDINNICANQANLSRVESPDENGYWAQRPSEIEKNGSKVDGVYYYITGSSAACSEDNEVQGAATLVRSEWLKQSTSIASI